MKKLLLLTAITLSLFSCSPDEQEQQCPKVTQVGTLYNNYGMPIDHYVLLDNGVTIHNTNLKYGDYYCN